MSAQQKEHDNHINDITRRLQKEMADQKEV
jgi:hypothetical protein